MTNPEAGRIRNAFLNQEGERLGLCLDSSNLPVGPTGTGATPTDEGPDRAEGVRFNRAHTILGGSLDAGLSLEK